MSLHVRSSKQFEKELKKQRKRGKDLKKFAHIARMIANQEPLPERYRNHKLNGDFKDHWECHIEPDWLLIYLKTRTEIIFVRTGSHSDLF